MTPDIRVAQLLSSRLCHDLVGPAGALGNGIELLKEIGNDAEIIDLIVASAGRLMHQLDFFRMAFGLRGGTDTDVGWGEAHRLAAGLVEDGPVALDWPNGVDGRGDTTAGGSNSPVPAAVVRLVLCLVLVAVGALPRGGGIGVRIADADDSNRDGRLGIAVTAKGDRLGLDADVAAAMTTATNVDDLSARTAHGYFAARLAQTLGASIEMARIADDELRLSVRIPDPA